MDTLSQIKLRFFSLKWKVLIALSLLLLIIYIGLFWLGFETLYQQQKYHLNLAAQRFSNSLDHVIERTIDAHQHLADTLANGASSPADLGEIIDKQWQLLHLKWQLQSVILADQHLNPLTAQGEPIDPLTQEALIETVRQRGTSTGKFDCKSTNFDSRCSLITAFPVMLGGEEASILIIGIPITDIVLNLSRANLIEAAVLLRDDSNTEMTIKPWEMHLVAASDLDAAFDLLEIAARKATSSAMQRGGVQIGYGLNRYYLRAINTDQVADGQKLLIILMDDITAQHDELVERTWQMIIAAVVSLVFSEIFLLLVLWHPMERIKRQAQVLPRLADGHYHLAYTGKDSDESHFRDELDVLEESSVALARNLERMGLEIRQRSIALERMAHYDELTGLDNRRSLETLLIGMLGKQQPESEGFALLFIDLDNFKRINDSLGHDIGDKLLIEIARRLRSTMRISDMVARLGGDEFVVVLRQVRNSEVVTSIVHEIMRILQEPIDLGTQQLHVSGSIGITMAPDDGRDASTLMKNADLAMYLAKQSGRNIYQFFTPAISEDAKRFLEMEIELEAALERNQFVLFYQPIVNLIDQSIVGLEALVRWNHPDRGIVAPAEFIAIMEQNGMIAKLGRKVIALACRDLKFIKAQTSHKLVMSINLSSRELSDTGLPAFLQEQILAFRISPGSLKFEITESVLMENFEIAASMLNRLKSLGVKLSIDDFGTGYSSLSYLKKLPVDELKIDRSFVCDTPGDASSNEIVAALVAMSHKLNLSVVAEGIENVEQLRFLSECRCDLGQGYYFQRPMARNAVVTRLQQLGAELAGDITQ